MILQEQATMGKIRRFIRYRTLAFAGIVALLILGSAVLIHRYDDSYAAFARRFERWAENSGITQEDIEPFFTFTYGGYQYCYHGVLHGEPDAPNVWVHRQEREFEGWSVLYLEDEEEPGWILEEAFGYPVMGLEHCFSSRSVVGVKNIPAQTVTMRYCFYWCRNLKKNPPIPDGVKDMAYCFAECGEMESFEGFPEQLEDMMCCFYNCPKLRSCSRIPENVKNLDGAFCRCYCLSGELQIDATPEKYDDCFHYCSGRDGAQVVLSGKAPREVLEALKETGGFVSAKNFTVKTESTE